MPNLVATTEHELRSLNTLTASWVGSLRMGLHQTTAQPQRWWTKDYVTPAVFSGYVGTIPLVSWDTASLTGEVAATKAAPLAWYHNGGPVAGYVCGYYVVDGASKLRWVYTYDPPYVLMTESGQVHVVRPDFTLWSWFPQV